MLAEGLHADVGEVRLFERNMAGGAAIYNLKLGNPYLLEASGKAALQLGTIWTAMHQPEILPLVLAPITKEIAGGSNRGDNRQQHARGSEAARDTSEWIAQAQ
jgi:hypothetical protein